MWGGLLTIMEKIKVEKVLISKQGKKNHNYEKFKEVKDGEIVDGR